MRSALLILLVAVAGCDAHARWETSTAREVSICPDTTSIAARGDSLARELRRLQVRVRFAEDRALRYARIVQRTPSQSKYLNGWMRRAFDGVLPDSGR
jgi:hypothetical protein